MIVVDASALVEAALRRSTDESVARRIFADDVDIQAPHHLDLEVLNALRKLVRGGLVSLDDSMRVLELLERVPIRRHAVTHLRRRIWTLRDNLSPYDAAYVALAEALQTPLVTCDGRLARAPGHEVAIEHFEIR